MLKTYIYNLERMTVAFAIQQLVFFLLWFGRPKWCFYVEATFHRSTTEFQVLVFSQHGFEMAKDIGGAVQNWDS